MTCIVAIEHEGDVYVGADSAGIRDLDICSRADQKVFINDEFIMGFCGSFRVGQLLRYSFDPPERSAKQDDDMAYMVDTFTDAVRTLLKDKGSLKTDDGVDEMIDSSFIVGYNGHIYTIEEDFQIGLHTKPYFAVGAGAQIALGSLYSTESFVTDPQERLKRALDAAAEFSAAVCAPYTFMCLKKETVEE